MRIMSPDGEVNLFPLDNNVLKERTFVFLVYCMQLSYFYASDVVISQWNMAEGTGDDAGVCAGKV